MYKNITRVISPTNDTFESLFNTTTTSHIDGDSNPLSPTVIVLIGCTILIVSIIMSWYTKKCIEDSTLPARDSMSLESYSPTTSTETTSEFDTDLHSITIHNNNTYHALTEDIYDDDLRFSNVRLQFSNMRVLYTDEQQSRYRDYVLNNIEGEEIDDDTAFQLSSVKPLYNSKSTQAKDL